MRALILSVAATTILALAACQQGPSGGPQAGADMKDSPKRAGTSVEAVSEKKDAVTTRKPKKGEVGKPAVCPVMGGKFAVHANSDVAEYKGKTYYMCCPGCIKPFSEDPEKYIKG
ncbi:YHS domain-containing protein [Elusimicrobiota bacterium]